MAREALTFLWVIKGGWKIRFNFGRNLASYLLTIFSPIRNEGLQKSPKIASWDANGGSCTIPIRGSKSIAHRFLNSHSSSRPCDFAGLWTTQNLSKIQTDHKVTMKMINMLAIACFILLSFHPCFINLHSRSTMARRDTGTIGMGVRWCDPSDGVTRRGWLNGLTDLCLYGRRANGLVAWKVSQCFTRFHKPQSLSYHYPIKFRDISA